MSNVVHLSQRSDFEIKSIPQVLKALTALRDEINAAETYEHLRSISDRAQVLKSLYKDIEKIRHKAEDIILAAFVRIGQEIEKVQKASGRPKKIITASGNNLTGRQTLGIPGTKRSRQQKLAKAEASGELKKIVKNLRAEGKAATPYAVFQVLTKEAYGLHSQQEQINKFIRRLNHFWTSWGTDVLEWKANHPEMDEEGKSAMKRQLFATADMMMRFAQELDER